MKKRVTVKSGLWVLIIVAFLLCAAIVKLLYVSVSNNVDGMNLKEFASSRNTKTKTLYASRGTIYDNAGEAIAVSANSYTLIAYLSSSRTVNPEEPKHVVDKKLTAEKLAPVLGISEEKILEYLDKTAYQVEFGSAGKNLTESKKKEIENLELPGIDFIEGTQRYYKMGNFASYLVGYAKTNDNGDIVGELGIESYFNDELSGKDGYITYQKDAYGYQLPNVPSVSEKAESGSDIYLTLDSNIQLIAENAIHSLKENYEFEWALMTVMDASTGAIVASSTYPSFDPNDLNTLSSYLNPLVSYTYEPGSTMKIFSWASAIEEGVYDGTEEFKSGSIEVADAVISDSNKIGWGTITFDRGFAYSSNVAATLLSKRLGTAKLTSYYQKYGFGEKTGIELSAEVQGTIDFTYETELASAAFGQGVTITPIEMLQALTALTNDGIMLKPYIVQKIVDDEGNITYEGGKEEVRKTMEKTTAEKMRSLMYNANYDGLSNMWQPKTVSMLIKTGTAQIASPSGGYLKGQYDNIYSLAGIFPAENPKYIIYTAVKQIETKQRNYADVVTKAVDEIASYAELIETDKQTINTIIELDRYISYKTEDAQKELENLGLKVIVIGNGAYVKDQYPLKGVKVVSSSKVFLITSYDSILMHDIKSWSLSEIKIYAKLINLNLEYTGYGYVKVQSIESGTEIKSGDTLTVELGT